MTIDWRGKPTDFQEKGSGLFSPFISTVFGWSASLLFHNRGFDSWLGHWRCGVNGLRGCYWLVRMIFVEQANKLPEVLDC